ncbi:MAG TPA: hypothetical protein VJ806_05405 [Luteimonas sp.]|nr:hypothetical protein [Luteimonas sp.]
MLNPKSIFATLALLSVFVSGPVFARFVSVDPVKPNTNNGNNFNRYWYANNNPYKYTDPDGREVKGQYHQVVPGAYHLSIRVTPDNQDAYKNDPRFLTDSATGERYTTFGAGPELSNPVSVPNSPHIPIRPIVTIPTAVNLVSNNNRPSDAERSTHPASNDLSVALPSQYSNEDQFIGALFSADANYRDNISYGLPGGNGYNSNSYANGLLQAVGAQPLVAPVPTPLSDNPLPKKEFEK